MERNEGRGRDNAMMNVSFSALKANAAQNPPIVILLRREMENDGLSASTQATTNLSATMPVRQSGEGRLNRLA
jgi:hypothetical protein